MPKMVWESTSKSQGKECVFQKHAPPSHSNKLVTRKWVESIKP